VVHIGKWQSIYNVSYNLGHFPNAREIYEYLREFVYEDIELRQGKKRYSSEPWIRIFIQFGLLIINRDEDTGRYYPSYFKPSYNTSICE